MKHIFTKYKVQLVKEKSTKYDIERKISNSSDANTVICDVFELDKESEEVFFILALDINNTIIGGCEISRGTIDSTQVHPREVFKRLILSNAYRAILAHNHPSGKITPSDADKCITTRLRKAGELLGIEIVDHVIIGDNNQYYSFAEHNWC